MKITARLDEAMVQQLLSELLPARVLLDNEGEGAAPSASRRWILIEPARHVDFVAGEGLRVETSGQLQWSAAGVPLTMTFHSAQLMLRPVVVDDADGGRLVFLPSMEALDLKNVPGFLETGVLALVNKRLAAEGETLAWHFGRTLALQFPLPTTLIPLDRFHLGASGGAVEVLSDAIVFSLGLQMNFSRDTGS